MATAQIPPDRILSSAVTAMNDLRVYPAWRASLEGAAPDLRPRLVRIRAAAVGTAPQLSDYYIVTFRRAGGITARFAHAAGTGKFIEAEAVRTSAALLPAHADHIEGLALRLADRAGPPPEVVWYPCVQSTSRFLPFWTFPINGRPVYIRADGVIFDQLTFTIKG